MKTNQTMPLLLALALITSYGAYFYACWSLITYAYYSQGVIGPIAMVAVLITFGRTFIHPAVFIFLRRRGYKIKALEDF